jgi:RNA polymerase sigma factor (sigma-70 family)
MHSASDDDPSQFTSEHLAMLRSIVKRNASTTLSKDHRDDIAGEILLSACVTASRPGSSASIAQIAFSYAKLPSYYSTVAERMAKVAEKDPTTYEWTDSAVSNATLSVDVRNVLSGLDPASRQIIWLCDVEGLTLSETATILGISTTTAHRRLEQAQNDFKAAWTA